MKKGLLIAFLFLGALVYAEEKVVYENRDLGIVIEIPNVSEDNWEEVQIPSSGQFSIYHADQGQIHTSIHKKTDSKKFGDESIETIRAQMEQGLNECECFDPSQYTFEILSPQFDVDIDLKYFNYRLKTISKEAEAPIYLDIIRIYGSNDQSIIIYTGSPWADEEELTAYTESLLASVRFIED